MAVSWHWFVAVLWLSQILAVAEGVECEPGWLHMPSSAGGTDVGLCIQINTVPSSWQEARANCSRQISTLMYLDRIDRYGVFVASEESYTRIGGFLVDANVLDWWSGLHVHEDRLMWDDYGPRYAERTKWQFVDDWTWKVGQPDASVGQCGRVITETVQRGQTILGYSQMVVGLDDCNIARPYVCHKPPIQTLLTRTQSCEDGWIGNQYLPDCYAMFENQLTQNEAISACQEKGGKLAEAGDDFHLTMLTQLYFFTIEDLGGETTPGSGDGEATTPPQAVDDRIPYYWVKNIQFDAQGCHIFDTTNFTMASASCTLKRPYICTKPTVYTASTSEKFVIHTIYDDQKELAKYGPFAEIPLNGKLNRTLLVGEVVFLHTPSGTFNSTKNFYDPMSEVFYDIIASKQGSNPHYVNVTLPPLEIPARRRRRGVSAFVDYGSVPFTTGYYGYEIHNINPPRRLVTEPVLVRYAEPDWFVYILNMTMRDWLVVTDGQGEGSNFGLTPADVNSFNLFRDDSYASMLSEYTSGFLGNTPTELTDYTLAYYNRLEMIQLHDYTLKYRLFLAPSNPRTRVTGWEQTVLMAIKKHLLLTINNDAFIPETLQLYSTVACSYRQTTRNNQTYTLPSSKLGQKVYTWERCYPQNKARAYAMCQGDGYDNGVMWGELVYTTGCGAVPQYNTSSSTVDLKNLSETTFTDQNFNQILRDTVNLTDPTLVNNTEADIIYVADILYNYLTFGNLNTKEVMEDVMSILNNVLNAKTIIVDLAQKINNAANRIIQSVDDLTYLLDVNPNSQSVKFVRTFVAAQAWRQTGSGDLIIGISLNATANKENATGNQGIEESALSNVQSPDEVEPDSTNTAIYIAQQLVQGGVTKLSFHIYANTDLFSVVNSRFKVNSKVAAARLSKNGEDVVELGGQYVTAVFETIEVSEDSVCAYWDYAANQDAGGWRTDGCSHSIEDGGKTIVCKCDHLTNFAVLIDLEAHTISDTDKLILGIITKVGLGLSIIGLGLTILTFIVFKHLRSGRGQQVLINLSVSMICTSILFLAGMERTESYAGCIVVAALLHYFILVSFMWMLVEGVLQYLRFVKVLGTYIPHFMKKSMIPAWGIPLIPVVVLLVVDYDMYFGGNGYCWLERDAMLYAFIIPVAVIILANIIVFTMVMVNLCRRRNKGMTSNQSERKMAMLHFQAGLSIFVILGLTWVFGFLAIEGARVVFHYIFAVLNALQGFFIFLLFTAREKQIRNAWRKMCCKSSAYKSTTSSDSHPKKHTTSDSHTNSSGLLTKTTNSHSSSLSRNGAHSRGEDPLTFNNKEFDPVGK